MKTELDAGETVLKSSNANLQRGAETVGGRLHLTDRRLIFESHAFNIQSGASVVGLGEIVDAEPVWTLFLNSIPVMPNSLAVRTRDGGELRFVLFGRKTWRREILQAAGRPTA
ncbi:GRAM domain-containing protein [Nesterenkonia halobia]|uniref:GRAM domain-containing protein n=1 Tax=Nesterenkonia halobia TaxID=37922 RepID=A0ABP6RB31_9MICC